MPIVVEKLNHAYMEGSTLAHDALKVYVCAAFERPFAANFRKCDGGWL